MLELENACLFLPDRDDLPAFAALDQLCLGGMWTLGGYEREWESDCSFLLGLRPQGDRQLLGMGCFWQILDEAHITLLAVHPQQRGRGWGKLLLTRLLQEAGQRQLTRATLEVRASNTVALGLYGNFDFTVAGRRRRYYPDQEDALILWRSGLA